MEVTKIRTSLLKIFCGAGAMCLPIQSIDAQPRRAGLFDFQIKDGQPGSNYEATYNHDDSSTFTVGRVTLFLDADINENMFFTGELQSDLFSNTPQNTDFNIRTAAVTVTNIKKWRTNIQFGRFNSVFGSYVNRRLPVDNPLFDAPLAYSHMVNLDLDAGWVTPDFNLSSNSDVRSISIAGKEQVGTGVKFFAPIRGTKLSYAFSLTNNPSSNAKDVNTNGGLTAALKMNWIADHTTNFGFSYSTGSYLNSLGKLDANNALLRDTRFGAALNESQLEASGYLQTIYGLHWNWERDRYQVNTEYMTTTFEVPNNPTDSDLAATSFYVQGKYNFTKNLFGAARLDTQSFENNVYLPLAVGTAQKWDDDITRIEVGMGNFINESTLAKITYQSTDYDLPNNLKDFDMFTGQVSVIF